MRNVFKTEAIKVDNEVNDGTECIVWDAMMGSGKTVGIIEYMLSLHNKTKHGLFGANKEKFVYISPYLEQCHDVAGTTFAIGDEKKKPIRVENEYGDLVVKYENVPQAELKFCHPNNNNKDGSKQTGLLTLLDGGANVVSTHALLRDLSIVDFPNMDEYTLVIDETLECFVPDLTIKAKAVETFLLTKVLSIADDGITVNFHRENYGRYDGSIDDTTKHTDFEDFAKLCDKGLIKRINGALLRMFDFSLINKFKRVIIMTYNYKGSMFDLLMRYNKYSVNIEYFGNTVDMIKPLININTNSKDNSIGDYGLYKGKKSKLKQTLTATHYKKERKAKEVGALNKAMYNKLYNLWVQREKKDLTKCVFTCYKDDVVQISKGSGKTHRFKNSWLAYNTRAINSYSHCTDVAYLVNPYCDPNMLRVISSLGLKMSHKHYSLNTLIQFVFRSRVRKLEEINLYIPSERMRTLFQEWLDGEVVTYATEEDDDNVALQAHPKEVSYGEVLEDWEW